MLSTRSVLVAAFALALCQTAATVNPGPARGDLRHGIIYYVPTSDTGRRDTVADRYEFGVTGIEYGTDVAYIKARKPSFEWYHYNSGSDNYVPSPEDDLISSTAAAHGWDPESAYMHYWNDTQITLQGQTISIPGWGGGSATNPADARVVVYYANKSRRVIYAGTPEAAQIQREVMVTYGVMQTFNGTNIYPDGIFLDNSAHALWNTGSLVSGGQIREHPTHAIIGGAEFQDWYWNDNYGPFLTTLKDTLGTAASWHPDGKAKKLMINNSNSWSPSYMTYDVADVLLMEFQYSPVRNNGTYAVLNAFSRIRDAHNAGIEAFLPSLVVQSVSGYAGSYTYAEGQLGNLAFYLAARAPSTSLFMIGTFDVSSSGWESSVWNPAIDVANTLLGESVGDPYSFQSGTDPRGYNYLVTGRDYENGLVLVRSRGAWNEDISTNTAVQITLPSAMSRVAPDGSIGSPTTSLTLRNGEGCFLLGDTGGPPPPPDTFDPVEVTRSLQVLYSSPVQGDGAVPADAEVRFLLSDQVNATGVGSSWVSVTGSVSGPVSGTVTVDGEGTIVVFRASAPFQAGETVTAVLSSQVPAVFGETLDGNGDGLGGGDAQDDYQIAFTVAP